MAKPKIHYDVNGDGDTLCGIHVHGESTTGRRDDVTCGRCQRSLDPQAKPRGKIHAFQIVLASHVKSLCERYPGWDNIATNDADVTCKECIKEMDPYRRVARTRALNRKAEECQAS